MRDSLPDGLLMTWLGDDFTGAAAVMEVLTFSGMPSVLFFDLPTNEQLARFTDLKGIGIASTARALDPKWMSEHLPSALEYLQNLDAQFVHYKVCSTLDSSPEVGSIGCAMEIGSKIFNNRWIPIMVAAPQMRRYQCFGNLFAGTPDGVYRLDHHPVMSHHPTTPMNEANVANHISRQTNLRLDTIDLESLTEKDKANSKLNNLIESGSQAITIDNISPESEAAAGRLIWENRDPCQFIVGSQGVEYAVLRHLRNEKLLPHALETSGIGEVDCIAVVSGSISPITADQIEWSLSNGFEGIQFDASIACGSDDEMKGAENTILARAHAALEQNKSPLIYTARGPNDPAVMKFAKVVKATGTNTAEANQRVGEALGRILGRIVQNKGLQRVVISGGDTSGYAARQLGIFALTALAPTIPGAAIFQAHADGAFDGLELALKGGQMGSPDYFGWVRAGGGPK